MRNKRRILAYLAIIITLGAGISHFFFIRVFITEPTERFFWVYRYDKGPVDERFTIEWPWWATYIDGIWVISALIIAVDSVYMQFIKKRRKSGPHLEKKLV